MKLLLDFLPIALFFVTFKVAGLLPATLVIMGATLVQVGWHWFRHKKVEPMHLISLAFVLLLGGATVIFRDERFIKWKPSVAYIAFALIFAGSHFFGSRKPLIERMAGSAYILSDTIWRRLNVAWILFFFGLSALNLLVALHFPTEVWVNFKLFGLLGLTLTFAMGQALMMGKYGQPKKEESDPKPGEENAS